MGLRGATRTTCHIWSGPCESIAIVLSNFTLRFLVLTLPEAVDKSNLSRVLTRLVAFASRCNPRPVQSTAGPPLRDALTRVEG